jgi:uncharacterized protein (DUF305 family)
MSRPSALLVVLLMLLVPGCTTRTELRQGSLSDLPSPRGPAPHSRADASYANELGDLHEQAVEMATMVDSGKPVSAAVRDLAARVSRTRLPAMVSLDALRGSWHVKRRRGEGPLVPGRMTDRQLTRLRALGGSELEGAWLDRMVRNYRGAVALSRSELERGSSPEARRYAAWVLDELEADLRALKALRRPAAR